MTRSNDRIRPKQTWQNPREHWKIALLDDWYRHLVRIQHELQRSIQEFFMSQGLITILAPLTTGSISSPMGLGSDSLPVAVDLFGIKTYLADSMQFMLEFGCRLHKNGVYYLMPSFRGECTDTRHLSQFFHAEAEIPGQLADIIKLAGGMVHFVSEKLLERAREPITALTGNVAHIDALLLQKGEYPQIRMQDALAELRNAGTNLVRSHKCGFEVLTKEGEAELVRRYGPIWVTHFDHCSVPFYQAFEAGTNQAMNADLILGSCETVGSGQRHVTSEDVRRALKQHQVGESSYEWYMTMRDLTPIQTAGFGMGLERYLLWLLNHDDIRDLMLIYRENRLDVVP